MGWLVARLVRSGFRRGLLEGSRAWMYVGVTAAAVGVARRLLTEPPETVFSTELKPGQGIEVRTVRRDERGRGRARGRR
jgi:hypothetical protein